MSRNPENYSLTETFDVGNGHKEAFELVSANQLEVAKKYGVSDKLIAKMLDEQTPTEEKNDIFANIVKILANAILYTVVDPSDIEDVSAIVGPVWGASKEKYLKSWNAKHEHLV